MASINYLVLGHSRFSDAGGTGRTIIFQYNAPPSAASARVNNVGFDAAYYDAVSIQVAIIGLN